MSTDRGIAAALWCARQQGGLVARDAADGIQGVDAAYRVQEQAWDLSGMARGGWKVGATSAVAQRRLGLAEPATAPIWAPECTESPIDVVMPEGQFTSVESEFAFRFARDLPARDAVYTPDEVLDAVDAVIPAIEIVGSRFEGGFTDIGAERLICDMVANKGWVAGTVSTDGWRDRDYAAHAVTLRRNGEVIAEGTGAEVLGDPFNVLVWTANHLAARGHGLKAGEVVSTGTCTGIQPVEKGDTLIADFGDLGTVEVRF